MNIELGEICFKSTDHIFARYAIEQVEYRQVLLAIVIKM